MPRCEILQLVENTMYCYAACTMPLPGGISQHKCIYLINIMTLFLESRHCRHKCPMLVGGVYKWWYLAWSGNACVWINIARLFELLDSCIIKANYDNK